MPSNTKKDYSFQIFIINSILFLLFAGYLVLSAYPEIVEIEAKKKELSELSKRIEEAQTKGMTYADFNILKSKWIDKNSYLSNLLKNITEPFYDRTIKNNGGGTFESFFQNKVKEIEAQKKENVVQKRDEIIQTLLPQYSSTDFLLEWEKLTDFKFINYVESILYTFNITTDSPIWINEIKPVEDYSTQINWKKSKVDFESIDSNIYYIPLTLRIKGKKEGILDFFAYAQGVGSIKIDEGDIKVFTNETQKKVPWPNPLNAYQNQLFDIESLLMKDYIDSSINQSEWDFIEFVKETQWRDEMVIDVILRFYIKWLPNYKIKDFVKSTVKKYEDLNKIVNQKLKEINNMQGESWEVLIILNRFRTIGLELTNLEKPIDTLNAMLWKSQSLDDVYKAAITYHDRLVKIEKSLIDDSETLDILKNDK